jgi:hypothetical protein
MYNEYESIPCFYNRYLKTQYIPENNYYPFYEVTSEDTYNTRLEESYIPMNMNENKPNVKPNVNKIIDINNIFRKLWMEHSIWTKLTIKSIIENSPDKDLIVKRLLQNPKDFERVFLEYYGMEKARKFNELLTDHLKIAGDLVLAAKNQNQNLVNELDRKWHENADEIATFLNSINRHLDKKEVQRMMYDHLALVKAEAIYIIENKYEESIKVFDQIVNQALKMADMYTEGILKQFPSKFMY